MPTSMLALAISGKTCSTEIITPAGNGPWPAVILCFDAGGQRPSISAIGERIAAQGYVVAIPDLYYRVGPLSHLVPPQARATFSIFALLKDPAVRAKWQAEYFTAATHYDNLETDVGALIAALTSRADVRGGVATTGYCMGGNISFRIATIFGELVRAAASFHGGGLVTAAPDSPHLRAAKIRARLFIAGASDDPSFTDDAKQQLIAALERAQVLHTVETYPAKHGFAVSDNPSFDVSASERHYAALGALLADTFRK